MKIAFLLYKYFPYGGLQRDFLRIAEMVRDMGHEVCAYVRSWEGDRPEGIEIFQLPVKALSNYGKNRCYYKHVKKALSENPVDRIVGFNKMPGLDVYYAADDCYAERISGRSWFYKVLPRTRANLEYEDSVFARGNSTKLLMLTKTQVRDFTKQYGTEADRFILLPAGAPRNLLKTEERKNLREKVRAQYRIQDDEFMLLQVGSNFKLKGVERTVRAVAALPENIRNKTKLFVLGSDDSQPFINLTEELGIKNQVKFLGGRKDVFDFMTASDLLLHPSQRESAGLVIVEALAADLPAVVTDTCGYSYHIQDSGAGIVLDSPFNQEQFDTALCNILKTQGLLKRMRGDASQYADTVDIYSLHRKAAEVIAQ